MFRRACVVVLGLVSACSIPDERFIGPSDDGGVSMDASGNDTGGQMGDKMVAVHWSFRHLADNTLRECPVGFDAAVIMAEPLDPITLVPTGGAPRVQPFPCAPKQGAIALPAGTFRTWVRIQDASGAHVYADSVAFVVNIALGDASLDVEILDDGGYFILTWSLHAKATGAPLTCAQAGVTSNGSINVLTVPNAGSPGQPRNEKFTCDDGRGIIDGRLAGTYTIRVVADENMIAVSDESVAVQAIMAPNRITDLGHVQLLIP